MHALLQSPLLEQVLLEESEQWPTMQVLKGLSKQSALFEQVVEEYAQWPPPMHGPAPGLSTQSLLLLQ